MSLGRQGRSLIAALTLLVVGRSTASAAPDCSQPAKATAAKRYDEATKHYRLGEYDAAVTGFKQAYLACPEPLLLFNVAQAYRLSGKRSAAAQLYRQYLSATSPDDPQREAAQRYIQQIALEPQDTDSSSTAAHAAAPSTETSPPVVPTTSAATTVTATAPERPRHHWYRSKAGWGLVAGGVVCGAASAVLLSMAANAGNSADHATTQTMFDTQHNSDLRFQQAGWPLLGVGAAGVAVGGILMAVGR